MKKRHLLITLTFPDNINEIELIKAESGIRHDISQVLLESKSKKEIEHFVIGDDEVINSKLMEEIKEKK